MPPAGQALRHAGQALRHAFDEYINEQVEMIHYEQNRYVLVYPVIIQQNHSDTIN